MSAACKYPLCYMDSDVITRSAVMLCGDVEKWFQIKKKKKKED